MNKETLKTKLRDANIYARSTSNGRNYICICPHCGDHHNPRKRGHLYVSTEKNIYHCFMCDKSGWTSKLLVKITGDKFVANEVFSKSELNPKIGEGSRDIISSNKLAEYKLPIITGDEFPLKSAFLKKRTNFNNMSINNIPGLILDPRKFFKDNNVTPSRQFNLDYVQDKFVCFLTKHKTKMFCRNADAQSDYKFVKEDLQESKYNLQDYYCYETGNDSNLVVLAEGVFDTLSEYYADTLGVRNQVKLYASCQGFNYSSVLKAICFDYQLFNVDVIILSDDDKGLDKYIKFVWNNEHCINNLNIYYNKTGKDFSTFPVTPVLGGNKKDVKAQRKNQKNFQRYGTKTYRGSRRV